MGGSHLSPSLLVLHEPSWATSAPMGPHPGLHPVMACLRVRGQGSSASYGCPGLSPEGWGGGMSQVGEREGFLQALTSASSLPTTWPERADLLFE